MADVDVTKLGILAPNTGGVVEVTKIGILVPFLVKILVGDVDVRIEMDGDLFIGEPPLEEPIDLLCPDNTGVTIPIVPIEQGKQLFDT